MHIVYLFIMQCNSGNLSWIKLTLLFLQCNRAKMYSLKGGGHLILAFALGGEGIDFMQVKSPPLARGVLLGIIH